MKRQKLDKICFKNIENKILKNKKHYYKILLQFFIIYVIYHILLSLYIRFIHNLLRLHRYPTFLFTDHLQVLRNSSRKQRKVTYTQN